MSFILIEKVLTGTGPEALSATSKPVSNARIQVKRANTHSMEIAPSATFASGKGHELLKPTTDTKLDEYPIVPAPNGVQGVDLADWYIRGTAGEGVNIIAEEF